MLMRVAFIAALALILTTRAADSGRRLQQLRTGVEYHLTDHRDVRLLGAAEVSRQYLKPRWRSLTDIMMRISAGGADVDGILNLPDGQRPHNRRSLFRVRLYAVVGGRIFRNAVAWCGAWRNNIALCEVDCDGGTFEIRRIISGSGLAQLDIAIFRAPESAGFSELDGISLTACDYDRPAELRLVPARGQSTALIGLTE